MSPDEQRAAKRQIVEHALRGPVRALEVPVPGGAGYRDRARLAVGAGGEVGFRHRGARSIVDVDACLLLAPAAAAALTAIRALASRWPAGTEIDLLAGNDGAHVAVRCDVAPGMTAAEILAAGRSAGITGVLVASAAGRAVDEAGRPDVDVAEPGGPSLRVPAHGFAQVGREANTALVRAMLEAIGAEPGAVLELYAGSGNFTRHLVRRSQRVLAFDGDAAAVERGRRNVPAATWTRHPPRPLPFVPDTVVADPPRAGLDDEHRRVASTARRRIVYISCDPQTLARDAALLARAGFALRDLVAFDLMPHTFHTEALATFERLDPPSG